jgi:hypothetical protein
MIAYSFFNQGMRLPRNRTEYDLDVLRNSVFSAGRDIHTSSIAKQRRRE